MFSFLRWVELCNNSQVDRNHANRNQSTHHNKSYLDWMIFAAAAAGDYRKGVPSLHLMHLLHLKPVPGFLWFLLLAQMVVHRVISTQETQPKVFSFHSSFQFVLWSSNDACHSACMLARSPNNEKNAETDDEETFILRGVLRGVLYETRQKRDKIGCFFPVFFFW